MSDGKQRIGELLVQSGLLKVGELERALEIQKDKGGRIVEICIQEDYFDAQDFLKFLSQQRTAASLDLLNYAIPRDVIDLVPAHFALKHELLPIDKLGKHLTVGMACPLDTRTIEELEQLTGCKVRPMLVSMNDMRAAIANYYGKNQKQAPVDFKMKTSRFAALNTPVSTDAKPAAAPAPAAPEPVAAPVSGTSMDLAKAESGIRLGGVVGLVRKLYQLPALPETVERVRAKLDDPKADARAVQDALGTDPGMVAKVLSLANSASHGFRKPIDTIEEACRLLGVREIYQVVLSAAVVDYFKAADYFDYRRFWRHSRFCAMASRVIVNTSGVGKPGAAYVAGLLYGLGRPAFAEVMTERYREVDQSDLLDVIIAKEEALFGISHPEAGYILADTWGLPPDITLPIRYFHRLEEATEEREMVATVALAALMTDAYGKITKDNVRDLARRCKPPMDVLGMDERKFVTILNESGRLFKELEATEAKG
ncbi:MAG: HDOD domain-containing protein [Candidatus Hydrogenedens sp.]|nr:HDOD domain-containing protein [Candidatus Hydrogenedens sp.]